MSQISYLQATIGGALIGLSATLLLLLNGRIAGISGILSGMIDSPRGDRRWRMLFVAGMLLGSALYLPFTQPLPPLSGSFEPLKMLIGGVIVGLGTAAAGGCTSGHGVCGLGRLSKRSFLAVPVFIIAGALTVLVLK